MAAKHPKRILASDKLDVQYCIPLWLRDEQIRTNIAQVKARIQPVKEKRTDPIAIVCYGPSLADTWEKVKGFKYIITCSGAHKFLIDRGIIPTWHCDVDPRKHKLELMGTPHKDVEYLMASTCHPEYVAALKDYNLKLWHIFDNKEEGFRILPHGEWCLTGGASAGLRAMVIARFLGFDDFHIFGMDGSEGPTGKHAGAHPNQPTGHAMFEYKGVEYKTTTSLYECARQTFHELDQLAGAKATFYGEGLVQAMAKDYKPRPHKKESKLAVTKDAVITPEYRELNSKLHLNPAYGVGGRKYVDTVLKIAESLKTKSILDYGCGKGLLAKGLPFPIWEYDPAIPGKDESPRPADLVVCTDVLEHIEQDCLLAVLSDLQRCVVQVGYFVIHTGPAQKVLADGRNAHLIQENKEWWTKLLSKFFKIGTVMEEPPELRFVVGKKEEVKKEQYKEQIVANHWRGTIVKFKAVNQTTEWRARTLFKKEPITIDWIETFAPGAIFWDIGANVGGYSIFAAARRAARAFAFEPESQNFSLLTQNIWLNEINATGYCAAISNENSLNTLFMTQLDPGGSCNTYGAEIDHELHPKKAVAQQGSIGFTIDTLSGLLPKPNHIKIDVDGLEHLVIAGAENTLKDESLKSMLIEINTGVPEHMEMVKKLNDLGFEHDQRQVDNAIRKDGPFIGCAEFVFRRVSDVEKHVIQRIKDTPVVDIPWPHIYVKNIFPEDFYKMMLSQLPGDKDYIPLESRGTKGYPERSINEMTNSFWGDLRRWILEGNIGYAFKEKFDIKVPTVEETLLLRDRLGYKIGPHTDTTSKVLSSLFYLPKSSAMKQHGTSLYTSKSGIKNNEGKHFPFEDFTKVKTMPFMPNTMFAFPKSDICFHGVETFNVDKTRNILLFDLKHRTEDGSD